MKTKQFGSEKAELFILEILKLNKKPYTISFIFSELSFLVDQQFYKTRLQTYPSGMSKKNDRIERTLYFNTFALKYLQIAN